MAYFAEKNFFEDPETFARGQEFGEGKLRFDWLDVEMERVRCSPSDPRRGLTYADCNVGRYGYDSIPEFIRNNYSMAARGSVLVPGLPDLGYTENRKSEVWSDNVVELYEEAKSRRWVPAVDVNWQALAATEFSPPLAAAMCQLCTTLEEIALVIMEFPSRWVFAINQEFLELKSYLCAQMIDEARHVEVFRKRALSSGGLKRASSSVEQALKELLLADTYTEGSLGINVLLNSLVLAVFSQAARASNVDATIFRLCMQDTARELSYGVGQLRYHLSTRGGREEALNDYLDRCEHTFVGIAASPELMGPLILLAGGGIKRPFIDKGKQVVSRLYTRAVDDYLERLAAAGLNRRGRSRLPRFFSPA